MSNPDFPGPSWQDKSSRPDGSAAYGGGADPYGRADDGRHSRRRPARPSGPARHGRGRSGYDASGDAGYARNGDAGYGRNGSASDGRNGSTGYGRNGDGGYGREDAAGEDTLAGRIGRRLRDHGARSAAGYETNGRRSGGSRRNGDRGYPGGGDRYGRRSAGYRTSTGLIEDDPTALRDSEYADLGDPWGPGRRGGGRGSGGGRRGPSGLLDPDGRRVRPPGNFWQRQWRASWWRHWTLKKAALVMGATALGTVLILIAGFFYVYSAVKLPLEALSKPLSSSSAVYFADSKTEVGSYSATNRTVLTSERLRQNKYLEQAFFAAEDRHFLTEGGISLTGTARALFVDLTGSGHQGGSTITEQYVKTYFQSVAGGGNLTYKEKLKEIIYAIKLAKTESKDWILTHYLNSIYLGNQAYGVEAAAQTYFDKHAWKLDPAQCAMLAAMVQAPSAYDPHRPTHVAGPGLTSLLNRWVYVLVNMAGDTYPNGQPVLTQQQLSKIVPDPHNPSTALKNFPKVKKRSSAQANWSGFRGYIMDAVRRELETRYGKSADQIATDGLHITTTFSLPKMRALYAAVAEAKKMMRQYGRPLPWYAHIGAVLENPKTGAIEASYGGPDFTAKHCMRIKCNYDMALVSRNQVGSSFKPYVLAAAVQQHMNVVTSKLNAYWPLCVPPETLPHTFSRLWKNYPAPCTEQGWYGVDPDPVSRPGPMSVKDAAALSSNPAFVDLAHRVGTANIIKLAKSFGVDISASDLKNDVGKTGIALGIAPLSVKEQATTFATFADDGVYHTPHVIAKITQNGQPKRVKIDRHRVLSHAESADTNWALSFDTIYGTGVPNAVLSPPRPTIAKTGTTDVAQSAFFIGAFPGQYSLAVGMFTNQQDNQKGGQTLDILPSIGGTGGGYGGAWPATIWRLYMKRLLAMKHMPVAQFSPLDLTGFQKWVQARPPKPKCPQGPGGGNSGPGNGNGHGHNHGIVAAIAFGKTKCPPSQGGSPSPSPSPSSSPSPGPSGSPSPGPSVSPTPTPTAGLSFPAQAPAGNAPSRKQAASTPSLTTSATLPRPLSARPGWVVPTTGLI